jgi:hypothetical protein
MFHEPLENTNKNAFLDSRNNNVHLGDLLQLVDEIERTRFEDFGPLHIKIYSDGSGRISNRYEETVLKFMNLEEFIKKGNLLLKRGVKENGEVAPIDFSRDFHMHLSRACI